MNNPHTFILTPKYDLLLRGTDERPYGLYQLQLATADQLCRLHYSPGTITTVKAHLKTLVDEGYVQADKVPTKQFSSPYYYTIGTDGMSYLRALGYDTSESWRVGKEKHTSWLFLDHTLGVNDVVIAAVLLDEPGYALENFHHERLLKRKPFKVSWQGATLTLIPDAFLRFRTPNGVRRFLIEHDRGTEQQFRFRQKVRAHIALYREEGVPVLFTTYLEHRLDEIRGWTRAELEGEARSLGMGFVFALLPQPPDPSIWLEPIWRSPYDTPGQSVLR